MNRACAALDADPQQRLTLAQLSEAVHVSPFHLQPLFKNNDVRGGSVSASLFERGLCLPSGSALTVADLERVTRIVRAQCPSAVF